MFTKFLKNWLKSSKFETPQKPPGSLTCPTCMGDGQALFRQVNSGKVYEDTCEDCQGKGHVFKFTESVYEI